MPYLPRYLIICDDAHFHVTWQCHNKDWLLEWNWAKKLYYDLLLKYKGRYGIEIYSYNLMDNHPHLTGHLQDKDAFSAFFRLVNGLFARAVNKHLKRRGQVVMDRFKSPRIETDEHMLNTMTYIDLNQYRAGKVKHPKKNSWSSYRYYAYGEDDPLLTPCPSYIALGKTAGARQQAYRLMVEAVVGTKSNISNTYFIGNPDWVIARYKEFRNELSERYAKHQTQSRASPS